MAFNFAIGDFFFARQSLVVHRMVLLLFPSVTMGARCLFEASLVVLSDECSWLPIFAKLIAFVIEDIRLSPKVLPVMCINALSFVMLLVKRAPLSLEVKEVEIGIFFHLMDQSSLELFSGMRERAIVAVLAFVQVFGVFGAILRLVFLRMVNRLYSVKRHLYSLVLRLISIFIPLREDLEVWSVNFTIDMLKVSLIGLKLYLTCQDV